MTQVLAFLLNNTFILFIISLVAGFSAPMLAQSGKLRQAIWAARIAFGTASLLVVLHLGLAFLSMGSPAGVGMNLLLAVLWGYFTWRDYRLLKVLDPK